MRCPSSASLALLCLLSLSALGASPVAAQAPGQAAPAPATAPGSASAEAQAGKAAPPAPAPLPATRETAQALPPPSPGMLLDDPSDCLGLSLGEAFARFGAPVRVSTERGAEAWQDDVVFDYGRGWSFSWDGERVWKIGFAPGYTGSVFGLFVGDSAEKAYSLLGTPWFGSSDSLVYRMPWRGYPVRLRILVSGDRVAGFQLYRADL